MTTISKDLIKTIRHIQIITTQLARDVFAGAYRSAFKGKGMEFEEDREYQAGDEVRNIDWNVTARMNHPFVKNFREERDLTVLLVVDVSASSRFGSRDQFKSELIAELSAVLAFSAIKNNDRVGLLLFSEIVETFIPPRKGIRHILRIIRELLAFKPKQQGSNLKEALSFLGKLHSQAGICFVVSDFICPDFNREAALVAHRYDLIAICVTDPHEIAFPAIGLANIKDLETGKLSIIDTNSNAVRDHFQKVSEERIAKVKHLMQKIGAGFIDIRTDQSYIKALKKFFKLRERRP